MPIYRYRCGECSEVIEVIAKASDPKPERCPSCGSEDLSKVMSRTSFQLKGGGWYAEGYAQSSSASGGASSKKSSGSASESSTSSEASTSTSSTATKSDD